MRRQRDKGPPSAGDRRAALPDGSIEQDVRQRLGRNLRLLYGSVLNQPLPDRFTRLLDDLSKSTPIRSDDSREGST